MKILQVVPSLAKEKGGPTQIILEMVHSLGECGITVEIVTTNDNGSNLLNVPLHQRIEYEKVPVWFFPRFSPPIKDFIFSADLTKWLWQHLADYDIVHTHYLFSYAPTCAAVIATYQRIPYIATPYGMLTEWAINNQRLKKQIYSIIERYNLNRAVAIHCSTAEESKNVEEFNVNTQNIVIPYGIHLPNYQSNAKQCIHKIYNVYSKKKIILYLSRIHYKKRPDLLIKALRKLNEQDYDFHLILAGSGEPDYVNHLKKLVASVGLTKHTSFAGFVTGEDKNLLLQGSDIFVLPSFSENFGVAVAEAMAAGLPVIVTPGVQISPEIAEAKAGLVVEGDVETLADAIATLLNSPHLRHELGENGKRLVSHRYSWKVIAQNLISVYTAIIEGKPLPDHLSNY
ncbi:MAG: glycosyltransferase [Coleofasciculus sp. A1-SPW-01]|uniref:glycosyltransferase n=1 Tax=Coleofasciculus sp. A1-SPW-01 TaxID=3070819 RepID=UPI0032F5E56D